MGVHYKVPNFDLTNLYLGYNAGKDNLEVEVEVEHDFVVVVVGVAGTGADGADVAGDSTTALHCECGHSNSQWKVVVGLAGVVAAVAPRNKFGVAPGMDRVEGHTAVAQYFSWALSPTNCPCHIFRNLCLSPCRFPYRVLCSHLSASPV